MKKSLLPIISLVTLMAFGCQNVTPEQRSALLSTANNLARVAAEAAATYYGGPAAGVLAGQGLDAVAKGAKAYVGSALPPEVLKASPGIQGVGTAVVQQIAPNHVVSQS